jgi:hypothetical protein
VRVRPSQDDLSVPTAGFEQYLRVAKMPTWPLATTVALIAAISPRCLADTFDYNGGAVIDCVCPSNRDSNRCNIASSSVQKYSVTIGVLNGMDVDLAGKCYDRRNVEGEGLCCENQKSRYTGSVGKKCVNSRC